MQDRKMKRSYTLIDLWKILMRRLWAILIAAVVVVFTMYLFVHITFRPVYSSVATLYVLRQENSLNESNIEDFSLALNVVNDCTYLLKSHAVLDEVIDQLSLSTPYEHLSRMITTSNPANTRILEVRVAASSPEEAKRIVDCVCRVGSQKIEEAMGFKQLNLYEYGTMDPEPSNKVSITAYFLTGLFAALFTYLFFVVYSFFDTSLHTDHEIEELLGVSIIGDIPNADTHKNKHYGYYGDKGKVYRDRNKKDTAEKAETGGNKEENRTTVHSGIRKEAKPGSAKTQHSRYPEKSLKDNKTETAFVKSVSKTDKTNNQE